jgi:transposase-like protein
VPLRKLADERDLSPAHTYARVIEELNALPDNTNLTKEYCSGYSGILIVDGKFVKVRGHAQKIPFIYGIDYLTHDIPVIQLSKAESSSAFDTFFEKLKSCNYPLKIVVADDRSSIDASLKRYFPEALIQRCQGHYLENIRQALHTRTDLTHRHFFDSLKKNVFEKYVNDERLDGALHHLLMDRTDHNLIRQAIVMDIHRRRKELFAYKNISDCPPNTNLIELYNSHLNGRLKTIKGFKSFHGAERWLNAYTIRRRTKSLTDCGPKFKHLNGTSSLEQVLKKQVHWPEIFGIQQPKTER